MKTTQFIVSNQLGPKTISYTFTMDGTVRTISKEMKVLDKPANPVVTST